MKSASDLGAAYRCGPASIPIEPIAQYLPGQATQGWIISLHRAAAAALDDW